MLSLILYGRNDNYGYNLHKRAALSLNCLAEVLTADGDEILFVDYNTPEDYPTFPEAIRDTLTARAQRLLRIFRVRPAQHAPFREHTHLTALEPVARNVALRRSNPENRWILSTNTDIILVPRRQHSLSDIVTDLEDALYHIPRFEIPETLWESLDRMDPGGTIAAVGRWGLDFHLNEIVRMAPVILYDGPGDFQLAPRADLFRIDGFDERMLLGWHLDSNLARRLGFLRGAPRSLADRLFGYHCDHMRQVTPAHRHDRTENDWTAFVNEVARAELPEQAANWGLAGEPIEEIRLEGSNRRYIDALHAAISEPMRGPTEIFCDQSTYGKITYDPRHVLPFLVDALSAYPRGAVIGWFGTDRSLLDLFAAAWRKLGSTGAVMIPAETSRPGSAMPVGCDQAPFRDIARSASAFVIDFGQPVSAQAKSEADRETEHRVANLALWFRRLVEIERARLERKETLRRFVAVNAVHGPFDSLVRTHIGAALAPIATRLRQGFVLPPKDGPQQLMSQLHIGDLGQREGKSIAVLTGKDGFAFFGGYLDLNEGRYRVRIALNTDASPGAPGDPDPMVLEVVTGDYYLAFCPVTGADLKRGEVGLEFAVAEELLFYLMVLRVEFRLFTRGDVAAHITAVTLERIAGGTEPASAALDWLPLMYVGPAGVLPQRHSMWDRLRRRPQPARVGSMLRAGAAGVMAVPGIAHYVVYGPYASLLPGRHCLEIELAPTSGAPAPMQTAPGQIRLDVFCVADNTVLAETALSCAPRVQGPERLEFFVRDRLDRNGNPMRLEFRVWSDGAGGFTVRAVRAWPLALLPITASAGEPAASVAAG